jgi:nitrite reductase (NADH) large subunit
MTKYLIIGNGVAGNSAAEMIRRLDAEGTIAIFSRSRHPFYYTPALPEYLSGEKELRRFTLHDLPWYEKNRVEFHPAEEVISIDPLAKSVRTAAGRGYPYERLLLATGGKATVVPLEGVGLEGVFTLRTVEDADRIREKARVSKEVILIGGGLLGLEAGNGLRKLGLEVSVLEHSPRLLPRQMDEGGAALLRKQMELMGFRFYLNRNVSRIAAEGKTLSVYLKEGEKLTADMVLISAGVCPEVTLAESIGIAVDRGVKVDDWMRTPIEHVYAAGDVIEYRGRCYGIWPAAMAQGRIAGTNMAGGEAKYEGTVPANTLKVAGIDLVSMGNIDCEGEKESLLYVDGRKFVYRKIVLQDSVIIGAILFGDVRGSDEIQSAIHMRKDIAPVKSRLGDPNFDFKKLLG